MRFVVTNGDNDYLIWDSQLKTYYNFGGIKMRGSKEEMERVASDLNKLNCARENLITKSKE